MRMPQMLRQEGVDVLVKPIVERRVAGSKNDRRMVVDENPHNWFVTKAMFAPYRSQKAEIPGDQTVSTSWFYCLPNLKGLRRGAIILFNGTIYDVVDDAGMSSTFTNSRRKMQNSIARFVVRWSPGAPVGQPLSGKWDTRGGGEPPFPLWTDVHSLWQQAKDAWESRAGAADEEV